MSSSSTIDPTWPFREVKRKLILVYKRSSSSAALAGGSKRGTLDMKVALVLTNLWHCDDHTLVHGYSPIGHWIAYFQMDE